MRARDGVLPGMADTYAVRTDPVGADGQAGRPGFGAPGLHQAPATLDM
ncbi:hypothetical protein [Streptomyces sp. NPDC002845]